MIIKPTHYLVPIWDTENEGDASEVFREEYEVCLDERIVRRKAEDHAMQNTPMTPFGIREIIDAYQQAIKDLLNPHKV